MKKADIVERIAEQNGWTRAESKELVDSLFMIIKDTLADGEELKVSGFGVFSVQKKNDRKGRNPQTGEDITINARKILKFRASLLLKKAVNVLIPVHCDRHSDGIATAVPEHCDRLI